MLFNSYAFLLAFLPVTLLGYFTFGRIGKVHGATWLAACSLFFYAWWDWRYLGLMLVSICLNYMAGRRIAAHAGSPHGKSVFQAAVVLNLLLLAYYKYADFFIGSGNAVLGTNWLLLHVVLPIGISFFTFTQIAFLADAYVGKVNETRFVYYLLFVTYFPHLIAGPVLHHKEMMPQFDEDKNYRPQASNFSVGMAIFALGLAKKVLIADNLAGYAAPVFNPAAEAPTLVHAWGGVLAYSFQLYFDFSGYSDMAIGLSRMFGVRLPLNFNSPYKSRNIVEFWRRWHMTLSRFLRDYLYIPMGGNRRGPARRHLYLVITMLLGGLWHGSGWTFVIWGALHGAYLVINHAWQSVSARLPRLLPKGLSHALAVALTFFCVVLAWVYFRAPDVATANRILAGMFGYWGASLPAPVLAALGPVGTYLQHAGMEATLGGGAVFAQTWLWVLAAAAIAFLAPNTQEIMAHAEPALPDERVEPGRTRLAWRPRRSHAAAAGVLLALGMLALSRPTEFLYFQF